MPDSEVSTLLVTRRKPRKRARSHLPERPQQVDQQTEPINLSTSPTSIHMSIGEEPSPLDLSISSAERQPAQEARVDVIVLDDTLPDGEIIDLTSDDCISESAGNSRSGTGQTGRSRRKHRSAANRDDDTPLVAVRTSHLTPDADVMVIQKENHKNQTTEDFNSAHDSLTPKRKMLSCPICMDHERAIRRAGRTMMSTTCGHIFCNECITQAITQMKCCPTCRKKLTKRTGIHPIFV